MATVVSANSIFTSWFFKINEVDLGLMAINTRGRLEGCPLDMHHAGPYTSGVPYTPADFETPGLIQQSVSTLVRSSLDPPTELPPFRWSSTASLTLNWANQLRDEIYLGEGTKHVKHVPIYDCDILEKVPGTAEHALFVCLHSGGCGWERTPSGSHCHLSRVGLNTREHPFACFTAICRSYYERVRSSLAKTSI